VTAIDVVRSKKGEKISKTLKGVGSWIFQHEIDHTNGKLIFIPFVI
jgi:peptide deformylase